MIFADSDEAGCTYGIHNTNAPKSSGFMSFVSWFGRHGAKNPKAANAAINVDSEMPVTHATASLHKLHR